MNRFEPLLAALDQLRSHSTEFRDLDAVLGDGDLGITVDNGAAAVQDVIRNAPEDTTLSKILMDSGRAFGSANPSTFAALTQGGLLAAAKATKEHDSRITAETLLTILTSCAESIAQRGGALPGDKTVLDPLCSSIEALETHKELSQEAYTDMVTAAAAVIDRLAQQTSARGRAAWVGERSAGHRDPGSVAYLRFLEALRDHAVVGMAN